MLREALPTHPPRLGHIALAVWLSAVSPRRVVGRGGRTLAGGRRAVGGRRKEAGEGRGEVWGGEVVTADAGFCRSGFRFGVFLPGF